MSALLDFAAGSPWLAFFLAWLVLQFAGTCWNRLLRTIKVLARGWPPAHLDADGDWQPRAEEQD